MNLNLLNSLIHRTGELVYIPQGVLLESETSEDKRFKFFMTNKPMLALIRGVKAMSAEIILLETGECWVVDKSEIYPTGEKNASTI